jgi:hypothetical protein
MSAAQQARIALSLRRLGYRLTKDRGGFKVTNNEGNLAPGSTVAMSLSQITAWIAEHVKPTR